MVGFVLWSPSCLFIQWPRAHRLYGHKALVSTAAGACLLYIWIGWLPFLPWIAFLLWSGCSEKLSYRWRRPLPRYGSYCTLPHAALQYYRKYIADINYVLMWDFSSLTVHGSMWAHAVTIHYHSYKEPHAEDVDVCFIVLSQDSPLLTNCWGAHIITYCVHKMFVEVYSIWRNYGPL